MIFDLRLSGSLVKIFTRDDHLKLNLFNFQTSESDIKTRVVTVFQNLKKSHLTIFLKWIILTHNSLTFLVFTYFHLTILTHDNLTFLPFFILTILTHNNLTIWLTLGLAGSALVKWIAGSSKSKDNKFFASLVTSKKWTPNEVSIDKWC